MVNNTLSAFGGFIILACATAYALPVRDSSNTGVTLHIPVFDPEVSFASEPSSVSADLSAGSSQSKSDAASRVTLQVPVFDPLDSSASEASDVSPDLSVRSSKSGSDADLDDSASRSLIHAETDLLDDVSVSVGTSSDEPDAGL